MMRRTLPALFLLLIGGAVEARPHPQLTPAAAALLADGPLFLIPDDNLAIPLSAKAKAAPFLAVKPERFEVVTVGAEPLLVIDADLYKLAAGKLALIAPRVGAMPSVSADGALIAGVEDKRGLKLTRGGASSLVKYHRAGNWELDRPYVAPDGARVMAVVRDYTQPFDAYDFVVVDTKSGEYDEVHLSKTFVPGALRQALSATQVLLQVSAQENDENGFARATPGSFTVFDLKSKKLGPAPDGLRPGLPSPDGRYSLLEGKLAYSDDKRCGGDETRLFEEGKPQPASFKAGEGVVVSALDFTPDSKFAIANVLTLKTCKSRGVLIPLVGDSPPIAWKPFPLPSHAGRLQGRLIQIPK